MTRSPTLHHVGDIYKVQSFHGRKLSLNFIDILKFIFTPDAISLRIIHRIVIIIEKQSMFD